VQLDLGVSFSVISYNYTSCSILEILVVESDQSSKTKVVDYLKNFLRSTYSLILLDILGLMNFESCCQFDCLFHHFSVESVQCHFKEPWK
jgi:hypothetical protein